MEGLLQQFYTSTTPELRHLGIEGPIERSHAPTHPFGYGWTEASSWKMRASKNQPLTAQELGLLQSRAFKHKTIKCLYLRDMHDIAKRMYGRIFGNRASIYSYARHHIVVIYTKGKRHKALPYDVALAVCRGDLSYPKKA